MIQETAFKLFEAKQVRSVWDDAKGRWYFAIVDVLAILTDSQNPQVYWRVMKKRLLAEGNETVTNCNGLKMTAPDGKLRAFRSIRRGVGDVVAAIKDCTFGNDFKAHLHIFDNDEIRKAQNEADNANEHLCFASKAILTTNS